jgi:exonuclease 3'-5' domain-containing protein 1
MSTGDQGSESKESKVMVGYTLVDSLSEVSGAVAELEKHDELALDAEGVDLSRDGPLTVLQIGAHGKKCFLFDVKKLGADLFEEGLGLKGLIESESVLKICYDCRADSDALYHQFGVSLNNVWDLQVWYQAYQREKGTYVRPRHPKVPYVRGMVYVGKQLLPREVAKELKLDETGPHKTDDYAWTKRPMKPALLDYAAADIFAILELRAFATDSSRALSKQWEGRILRGSLNYTHKFRDATTPIKWPSGKMTILRDVEI